MESLITFGVIFLGIIIACSIFITVQEKNKKSRHQNKMTISRHSNSIFPNKTKKQIALEANEKYNRISDKMKEKYLKDRIKSLKFFYILLSSLSFFISLLMLCLLFVMSDKSFIFPCVILGLVGIVFLIVFFVKLKSSNKSLILQQLQKVLKTNYKNLTNGKVDRYKQYVKEHSDMYKKVQELNNRYSFDRNICSTHKFYEYLNSKRQLDNFNYDKWIFQHINHNISFFNKFQNVYETNNKIYMEYCLKYGLLKIFREEKDVEDLELDFETFNYIENLLYKENKQSPIVKPNIILDISYTSPSGRNHYSSSYNYTYYDLLELVKEKEIQEKQYLLEQQKKEKAAQEKREKEKKLRELDKLEAKLTKKEKEINEKEKEFIEATREHIYTSNKLEVIKQDVIFDENLSLTKKLKILKEKFDNGEISYEEYQAKRKELI